MRTGIRCRHVNGFVNVIRRPAIPRGVSNGWASLLLADFRGVIKFRLATIGFELLPMESRIFSPEDYQLGLGLFQLLFQRCEFFFGIAREMSIAKAVASGIREQDVGPSDGGAMQIRTGMAILALESEGSFFIASHSCAIPFLPG